MAGQKGFEYEKNVAAVLKKLDITPKNFQPAGAGHDQPDLMIKLPGTKDSEAEGCELKIMAASAGSLVMKYDPKSGWGFNDLKADEDEKKFIRDIAYEVGIVDSIQKQWKDMPAKRDRNKQDAEWKAFFGSKTNKELYERDKKLFRDIKGEIPAVKIEQYYNKKKTYYVNVGTHGFYLLGKKNPLKLSGVPLFSQKAKAIYRARVQPKGGSAYQFTFEMQFSISAGNKSPFNIGPCMGKNSVTILENQLALGCFV